MVFYYPKRNNNKLIFLSYHYHIISQNKMGINTDFIGLLITLFPECFSAKIPNEDKEFDIYISETAHYIVAGLKGYNKKGVKERRSTVFNVENMTLKFGEFITELLADKNSKIHIRRGVILTMDNPSMIPHNKSMEQMKRDKVSPSNTNTTTTTTDNKKKNEHNVLGQEEYERLRQERRIKDGHIFFNNHKESLDFIHEDIIRRDMKLNWSFNRLFAIQFMNVPIPEESNKFLLIDEAVFIPSDEDYRNIRENVIKEMDMMNESEYAKETLMAIKMGYYYSKALITAGGNVTFLNGTEIGESDIKILSYIHRGIDVLVASPDSDVLIGLLLHIPGLLNPETYKLENKIYLDMQTRNDSNHKQRTYRYVNVSLLYTKIIRYFKTEFENIKLPIETLCLLFHSHSSDYIPSLANGFGPAKIWNTFSMFHTTRFNVESSSSCNTSSLNTEDRKFYKFSPFPKASQIEANRTKSGSGGKPDYLDIIIDNIPEVIRSMYGILNDAITIEARNGKSNLLSTSDIGSLSPSSSSSIYSPLSNGGIIRDRSDVYRGRQNGFFCSHFNIKLDLDKISIFFYIVYQNICTLASSSSIENSIQTNSKRKSSNTITNIANTSLGKAKKKDCLTQNFTIDAVELFIKYTKFIEEQEEDSKKESIQLYKTNKMNFQIKEKSLISSKNTNTTVNNVIGIDSTKTIKQKDMTYLDIRKMRSRIRRIEWTLNYYRNGWKDPTSFIHNFTMEEELKIDEPFTNQQQQQHGWNNLSCHGWKQTRFIPPDDSLILLGSSYYRTIFNPHWYNKRSAYQKQQQKTEELSSQQCNKSVLLFAYNLYAIELTDHISDKQYEDPI